MIILLTVRWDALTNRPSVTMLVRRRLRAMETLPRPKVAEVEVAGAGAEAVEMEAAKARQEPEAPSMHLLPPHGKFTAYPWRSSSWVLCT